MLGKVTDLSVELFLLASPLLLVLIVLAHQQPLLEDECLPTLTLVQTVVVYREHLQNHQEVLKEFDAREEEEDEKATEAPGAEEAAEQATAKPVSKQVIRPTNISIARSSNRYRSTSINPAAKLPVTTTA